MASDLQKAQEKVLQREEGSGNQKEASKLLLELKVSETKPVREDRIGRILFLLLINENAVSSRLYLVKSQNTDCSNYQNLHSAVNIYF